MLDDKTVTEHNIEDKSVQEVTAEATKVCCQCGKELHFYPYLVLFLSEIVP